MINFDIYALAHPKSRADCEALAREVLAELELIRRHIEGAAGRCEGAK